MTTAANGLFQAALNLSERDRAELADKLLESIEPEADADWADAWEAEVARRLEDLNQGKLKTVPWPEARRMISGEEG